MKADRFDYWRLKLHALGCLLLGKRDAAHPSFSSILVLWPENAHGLSSRAHLDEVVAELELITELQPMRPSGWCRLARLHVGRQDPDAWHRDARRGEIKLSLAAARPFLRGGTCHGSD